MDEADERAYKMAESGCVYIGFGAESADEHTLTRMQKGGFILKNGLVPTKVNGNTYQFPKIIDDELWKRVQIKIKNSRSLDKMISGGVRSNETLLQTYLKCSGCNKLMGRRKMKGKNVEKKNSLYVCRTQERLYTNPKLHIKCNSNKSTEKEEIFLIKPE